MQPSSHSFSRTLTKIVSSSPSHWKSYNSTYVTSPRFLSASLANCVHDLKSLFIHSSSAQPRVSSQSFMMLSLRAASRVSRSTRVRSSLRQLRHESTNTSNSSSSGASSLSQSLIGGLAGGGLVFLGGYTYYHFSGNQRFEASTRFHLMLTTYRSKKHCQYCQKG